MLLMQNTFFMITVISMTSVSYVQNFLGSFRLASQPERSGKYRFRIWQKDAKSFPYFFFSFLFSALVIVKSPL